MNESKVKKLNQITKVLKENKSNESISFPTLLTIFFIILKLTGVITWPWVWVLSPFWIIIAVSILLIIVIITWLSIK